MRFSFVGAVASLLFSFGGCVDVMSTGDSDTLVGSLFMLGLSVCLFVMGVRAK